MSPTLKLVKDHLPMMLLVAAVGFVALIALRYAITALVNVLTTLGVI